MSARTSRMTSRLRILGVAVALPLMILTTVVLHGQNARADDDGVGIDVPVIKPPGDHPPVTGGSGGSHNPPRSPGSGGPSVQTPVVTPADVQDALGDDPFNLGGVLYVSGLTNYVSHSASPLGGDVTLRFTVRNVSSSPITATADFWLDNVLGMQLDEIENVQIEDLKPNETRTVQTTMEREGQWTVLSGHVTLTPPKSVDGEGLTPVTRDTTVFLPPYFALLLVGVPALGFAAYAGFMLFRRPQLQPAAL